MRMVVSYRRSVIVCDRRTSGANERACQPSSCRQNGGRLRGDKHQERIATVVKMSNLMRMDSTRAVSLRVALSDSMT